MSKIRRKSRSFRGKVARELLGRALVMLGLHKRLLKNKAVVVAFHSITPKTSDGALRCSEAAFASYCRFFSKHMDVVSLSKLVEAMDAKTKLNGEVCITFDDGYADNAELALPILNSLKLPATVFVATGFLGSSTQAPWDASAGIVSRWMSWQQVKQFLEAGHEIGAHTVTHADLAVLDDGSAEAEMRLSRDSLLEKTGVMPRHFAIPYGRAFASLDQKLNIAMQLGFRSVCVCRGGLVDPQSDRACFERWPIDAEANLSPYGWIAEVVREALSNNQTKPTLQSEPS